MQDQRQRSFSMYNSNLIYTYTYSLFILQNNEIFSPDCYSKSECSPDKIKRKSQRSQQAIILPTAINDIDKNHQNQFKIYLDGNQKIIEGWLYQSKKVYIELTRESIREFNDEQKSQLIKVVSSKKFEFNIQQDKQIIKIYFPHLNQIVIYQAKDDVEAKMWVGCLNILYQINIKIINQINQKSQDTLELMQSQRIISQKLQNLEISYYLKPTIQVLNYKEYSQIQNMIMWLLQQKWLVSLFLYLMPIQIMELLLWNGHNLLKL